MVPELQNLELYAKCHMIKVLNYVKELGYAWVNYYYILLLHCCLHALMRVGQQDSYELPLVGLLSRPRFKIAVTTSASADGQNDILRRYVAIVAIRHSVSA